jgi:DNA modification methylase
VVFDPFAGSASLGEACHELGRKFIGVELCQDNYAKAASRLLLVKAQQRMFNLIPDEKQLPQVQEALFAS